MLISVLKMPPLSDHYSNGLKEKNTGKISEKNSLGISLDNERF